MSIIVLQVKSDRFCRREKRSTRRILPSLYVEDDCRLEMFCSRLEERNFLHGAAPPSHTVPHTQSAYNRQWERGLTAKLVHESAVGRRPSRRGPLRPISSKWVKRYLRYLV